MDKASVSDTGDCRFKSCQGRPHIFLKFEQHQIIHIAVNNFSLSFSPSKFSTSKSTKDQFEPFILPSSYTPHLKSSLAVSIEPAGQILSKCHWRSSLYIVVDVSLYLFFQTKVHIFVSSSNQPKYNC